MRVDNKVTQAPHLRTREHENHEAICLADNGCNRTRALAGGPPYGGNIAGSAGGSRGATSHGDAGGGGSGCGSSSHEAERRASGRGDRGGRGHADSHVTSASRGGYDARRRIEEIRRNKSSTAGDNDGFRTFST
jgi:hypothetical protein